MICKPRRGWWYLPGGKVEDHELWPEAARREFAEESGLQLGEVTLAGLYRVHIASGPETTAKERLIVQFVGHGVSGTLETDHREGTLAVVYRDDILTVPMDEGDRLMVRQTIEGMERRERDVRFGSFYYDWDHRLLKWSISDDGTAESTWSGVCEDGGSA